MYDVKVYKLSRQNRRNHSDGRGYLSRDFDPMLEQRYRTNNQTALCQLLEFSDRYLLTTESLMCKLMRH